MTRGRSIPQSNYTTAFGVVARNPGNQSLTHPGQVSHVLVTGPAPGTLLGNSSSNSNNPSTSSLQLMNNNTARTLNEQMMTTVVSPTGVIGTIVDSSQNSMINTPSINNNAPNVNPIKEKEQNNNFTPRVPAIQQKEKPMMTPNNGGRKQPETLVSVITADLSAIVNKSLPNKGETKEQEQRTKSLLAGKRGFKQGEDPISMILGNGESEGEREKGLPHSFFAPKKVISRKKLVMEIVLFVRRLT